MQEPNRERTLYEIASSFFALVVIAFALGGMLFAALGDEGVVSGAFAICTLFLLLGLGRLYLGLRRGEEGSEIGAARRHAAGPDREASVQHRTGTATRPPQPRRRRP